MSPLERKRLGDLICLRLAEEIGKLGFAPEDAPAPPLYDGLAFSVVKDPYSGEEAFNGVWKSERGGKRGEMKFHGDGSFYAEYDILRERPGDSRWFVEGVIAWGRGDVIKTEPKLIAAAG